MKLKYRFIDFLQEVHDRGFTGTGDDAPDDFNRWMEDMAQDELIDHADVYAHKVLSDHLMAKPSPFYRRGGEGGAMVAA